MKRIIAHIDMDCFFCACETKKNPSLAGKAVIVGATGSRGVVSAANYEARKFGVHSAMPITRARRLAPKAIYLPVDFSCYRKESEKIMEILQRHCDDMEQVSVDEAYMDITEYVQKFDSLERYGEFIRLLIKKQTGLSCSIGIGQCRTVSKIASDYKKPGGVTVVQNVQEFLAPFPIEKMPGIGKVSKRYYNEKGVFTIADLAKMNRFDVIDNFGMWGVEYQDIAQGNDYSGIHHRTDSKSMSREHTFIQDESDQAVLLKELRELCEEVYDDLDSYSFKTVSIKVRYSDFSTITRDITVSVPSQSLDIIKECVFDLWKESGSPNRKIRLLGVKLSKLAQIQGVQTTLENFAAA